MARPPGMAAEAAPDAGPDAPTDTLPDTAPDTGGRLAENIVHFARALRKAGVRVGPAQVEGAVRAVAAAGFTRRDDFYHTLRATLINRPEHLDVFHEVFALFWRDPEFIEKMIRMMSPLMQRLGGEEETARAAQRRAAEALGGDAPPPAPEKEREELVLDATLSMSARERLGAMDFEQMSAAEMADAARAMRRLALPVAPLRTRRRVPAPRGSTPDLRLSLRAAMRRGGEMGQIARRAPRPRPPDLVALCDISGSMSSYSRMLLHFLHALAWAPKGPGGGNWGRVSAFTFGTQLTNITRALHRRDIDAALAQIGREARDWQGGTRIGAALERFNKDWSRRVLGQGAVVLLITDGLERGDIAALSAQAERLRLSCRRLIWLNPLLRYEGFAPEARGVKALLAQTDSLHACHNLDSLEALAAAFAEDVRPR